MAIQKADPGGEYYYSTGISTLGVWSSVTGSVATTNSAPSGRSTNYAISLPNNGGVLWVTPANYAAFVQGGAFYIPAGAFVAGEQLMIFYDLTTIQVDLRTDSSGHLYFTRNGTTLAGTTSTNVLTTGWHYIEVAVTINGSTGACQVWVDNVSWASASGLNTNNSGNNYINKIEWCWINAFSNAYLKDAYFLDTGTGSNTSRLGDITVGVIYPNAAGVQQSWSNFGGSSETNSVQDGITHTGTWPDGDTTYIYDSVSGHISDFQHQTLGAGTLFAVVHASYCRNDSGAANFEQYTNSSGTLHTSSSIAAGSSYQYYYDILEVDPATSTQWTVSGFNSSTWGVKIP